MGSVAVVWWSVAALAAPPKASSEAVDDEAGRRGAGLAFDGLLSTSWMEGEPGNGEGSWIELVFDKPTDLSSVSIWPGDLSGADRLLRESPRPRLATLTIQPAAGEVVTTDIRFDDPAELGPLRLDVPVSVVGAKSVRLTVTAAHDKSLYSDMAVAEIAFNFASGPQPKVVEEHLAWLTGDASVKARDLQTTLVKGLGDRISGAEFGDREALNELMDYAIDGAPFVRERIARLPMGFRMQALPADTAALELLLTLKDANAIPAVSRAAVRSTGALQAHLVKTVGMFEAYQDLRGGGSRNVAPWGERGFGKGALQSFGEPLGVAADQFGGVWVADVGNHRVQRYRMDTGGFDKAFGAEPDMTNLWFTGQREFYAAGSAPGEALGQFTHPLDVAVQYGKTSDTVYVLDAKGRVSVITADDKVAKVIQLPVTEPLTAGQGGEGHLVMAKKKVVAVWGNEGYVVDPASGEVGPAFSIEDGVPGGAVGLPNGKLGLIVRDQLVLYSTDGFRFGGLLGDTMGQGYQDWCVATDEDGKLWAVTDKGEAVKFKKPGVVDYRVQIAEFSLTNCRLAVYDDVLFVTVDDKVLKADALSLHQKALEGSTTDGQLSTPESY
jgi:hypothetical protein